MRAFESALRPCRLGIKALQNVTSAQGALAHLSAVLAEGVPPDTILASSLFHMGVIRYGKPFVSAQTSEGRFRYPLQWIKGAEGFSRVIHDHLLRVRHTLIAHDDFSQIRPRIAGLSLTLGGPLPRHISMAVANSCLEYPQVGVDMMAAHVEATRQAILHRLAADLFGLMQVADDNPEEAKSGTTEPSREENFTIPPGLSQLTLPRPSAALNVGGPLFQEIGIVYHYETLKLEVMAGGEVALEPPGGSVRFRL